MIQKTPVVFSLAIATAAPLLKWLLDIASENLGKQRIERFRSRIELYNLLLSMVDDESLKDRIALAIRQDIEHVLPHQKVPQPAVLLSRGFVLYLITASAVVMLFTNGVGVWVSFSRIYVAAVGSTVVAVLLVCLVPASNRAKAVLVLPVATVVFTLAYLLNSIGMALFS